MRVRTVLLGSIVVAAAVVAGLYQTGRLPPGLLTLGGETAQAEAAPGGPPPAMPVPVAPVLKRSLPVYLDYSARTESIAAISLQAKVSGYIQAQPAADGSDVKQGDLLYKIDPRDFQAALDQANAQLQRDQANIDYLRSNYDRGSELSKNGWLDKDTFDQRQSNLKQAQATLAADQAAQRQAELNLGYTEIRAPFAGRLGRNQAPIGTLVSVGGSALNTLVQLDPIYVTFNPSENELGKIRAAQAAGKVMVDVLLPGETEAKHQGELTFLDNAVDNQTGTILARATVRNGDFGLLPGQYVRVRVHLKPQPDALMVPQVAVAASQFGRYVYVVSKDNRAEQRLVTLGGTDGALVSVEKGLAEGDRVITGNLQKIFFPGMPVQPLPQQQANAGS
ncbi:efflux RND transporter periplasmic adaptor subunit [Inquilinus sp. Marseille-Q2685]|uniref:efflux RND transporter periplasmic adaptor subunit n=1 Tax=Inquilinus sp. Marseille-Q2685 TaxID=2866581 RepID=UPI001CE3F3DE|nr:efflux RND transporter periplasmic adaptor subunit [Inquilinus sp. Marseille-Q2685]